MNRSMPLVPLAVALIGCSSAQPSALPQPTMAPTSNQATATPPAELPPPPAELPPPPTPDEPPAPSARAVDPASIVGYVRGKGAPEAGRGEGRVASVALVPRSDPSGMNTENLADLRFAIETPDQRKHAFYFIVPKMLPLPLVVGETVSFRSQLIGGGPNSRVTTEILDARAGLLLAIDAVPAGWTVARGRRVASSNDGDYLSHSYEVAFEHQGSRVVVAPQTWARLEADDGVFVLWASAVERQRTKAGKLPPDYVGGWLDSAIVRVR